MSFQCFSTLYIETCQGLLHYVAYAWRQICLRSYYRANPLITMVTRVSGHFTDNDTLAVHKYGMSFQCFSTLYIETCQGLLHYVAYAWRQIRANPLITMVTRVSGHCTDNDTLAVHKYGMSFQCFSTLYIETCQGLLHYVAYAWRQICLRSYYRAYPLITMVIMALPRSALICNQYMHAHP